MCLHDPVFGRAACELAEASVEGELHFQLSLVFFADLQLARSVLWSFFAERWLLRAEWALKAHRLLSAVARLGDRRAEHVAYAGGRRRRASQIRVLRLGRAGVGLLRRRRATSGVSQRRSFRGLWVDEALSYYPRRLLPLEVQQRRFLRLYFLS